MGGSVVAGMMFRSVSGTDGQISVPGLGAVIAEFQTWNLSRREEQGTAGPFWTLYAVFRYQNDLLLKNEALKKRILLRLNSGTRIELCTWEDWKVEGMQLFAEGVTQCQPPSS